MNKLLLSALVSFVQLLSGCFMGAFVGSRNRKVYSVSSMFTDGVCVRDPILADAKLTESEKDLSKGLSRSQALSYMESLDPGIHQTQQLWVAYLSNLSASGSSGLWHPSRRETATLLCSPSLGRMEATPAKTH